MVCSSYNNIRETQKHFLCPGFPSPAGEVAHVSLASVQLASDIATRMILQNTALPLVRPFTDSMAWRQSPSSLPDTQACHDLLRGPAFPILSSTSLLPL